MKQRKSRGSERSLDFTLLWLAVLAVLAMVFSLHAKAQGPEAIAKAGTMKVVRGDVWVKDGSGERVLQPGDSLASADRVVTGPNGSASMVMRDGTTMMLGPKSQIDISNFAYNSTTQEGNLVVAVLRGSMRMITGLISKTNPDAISVTTRTATIGVRGTDFIVDVDGEGQ